jgi:hypothetical protein
LMQARRCDACSAPVVSVLCASEEAREDGAARAGQRTSTHCGTPAQLCADQCRGSTRCTPTPTRWQWRCNELSRATGSGRAQTKGSRSWHSCRCCHTPPLPSRTGRIGTLKGSKPHSSQAIRVARCTATITATEESALKLWASDACLDACRGDMYPPPPPRGVNACRGDMYPPPPPRGVGTRVGLYQGVEARVRADCGRALPCPRAPALPFNFVYHMTLSFHFPRCTHT